MASTTLNTATVSVQETFALSLTDRAVDKVKDFAAKMPDAAGKGLRVFVQAGGCSGFQYGFTFDDAKETDHVLSIGDIKVLVDKTSAMKLNGSTVDWIEDWDEYHLGIGEVHCGTNATRKIPEARWWESGR